MDPHPGLTSGDLIHEDRIAAFIQAAKAEVPFADLR
jgi:hypothetical protein